MAEGLLPIVQAATPKELTSAVGSSLADVWQALVGDRIGAYRLTHAAAISEKLRAKLGEQGRKVDWSKVPDRYAVSWFEQATKEDEASLQELFATLLQHAAQGNRDALERRNVDLVGRLSPSDARLLLAIYEEYGSRLVQGADAYIWLDDSATFVGNTKGPEKSVDSISYENLENLGIIQSQDTNSLDAKKMSRWVSGKMGHDGGSFFSDYPIEDAVVSYEQVSLTRTGVSLLRSLFITP